MARFVTSWNQCLGDAQIINKILWRPVKKSDADFKVNKIIKIV